MSSKSEPTQKGNAPQRKPAPAAGPDEREPRWEVDRPGQSLVGLQRAAGNRATTDLLRRSGIGVDLLGAIGTVSDDEHEADTFADQVAGIAASSPTNRAAPTALANGDVGASFAPRGQPESGKPLAPSLLHSLESIAGHTLGGVRVHAGEHADAMVEEKGALAFADGQDIYFATGQYRPGRLEGRWLIAHEVAHTIQQASGAAHGPQLKPDPKGKRKTRRVVRVTFYVDLDVVVLDLDDDSSRQIPTVYNGHPSPGAYTVRRKDGKFAGPPSGTPNKDGYVIAWVFPKGVSFEGVNAYALRVLAGKPGEGGGTGGTGARAKSAPEEKGDLESGVGKGAEGGKGTGDVAGSKGAPEAAKVEGATAQPRLSPEEDARWRELYEKMTGAALTSQEDPRELIRLFQVLRDAVEDPHFSKTEGDPWVKWAKFLDQNRDKIEGILRGGDPPGQLTLAKLEAIIAEYQKFIVGEPLTKDDLGELKTLEDFEKEFEYDPGWQKLSKADKKLLLEYASATPEELSRAKVDFSRVTTGMKVSMALKLSESWPEEVKEAAKAAFSDPTFVITLVLIMAVYVGLWLTPDPSAVTKVAAGLLTVVLLAQFAWEDIYGFAVAWSELNDECAYAKTIPDLKAAGDKFAKKVGQVGFDIMMMIVMWRVGKSVGPKVQSIGARRGVVRAEAAVQAAEAKPGSGKVPKATPEAAKLLDSAKAGAKGTTPTAVLDALARLLPEGPRKALASFRAKLGSDMAAYRALEAEAAKGTDLGSFLTDKAVTPEVRAEVRAEALQARAKLAGAKLIEADTIKDPGLRKAVLEEQGSYLKGILRELGILERPDIKKLIAEGALNELIGALGEALQRTQLRGEFPASKGFRLLSNLAIVRRLPGFRTLAEWVAAEKAAGREGNPKKLFEKSGAVWEAIGEVDTMVVEPAGKGTFKPKVIEEAKTGTADKPSRAMEQAQKSKAGLKDVADGNARVFERSSKNTLGDDVTSSLDLSAIDSAVTRTRGPAGKGFTESLPYDAEVLQATAGSLITEGLPPKGPHPAVPPTRPTEKKREEEPAEASR